MQRITRIFNTKNKIEIHGFSLYTVNENIRFKNKEKLDKKKLASITDKIYLITDLIIFGVDSTCIK